jgi:hypothetical protein
MTESAVRALPALPLIARAEAPTECHDSQVFAEYAEVALPTIAVPCG